MPAVARPITSTSVALVLTVTGNMSQASLIAIQDKQGTGLPTARSLDNECVDFALLVDDDPGGRAVLAEPAVYVDRTVGHLPVEQDLAADADSAETVHRLADVGGEEGGLRPGFLSQRANDPKVGSGCNERKVSARLRRGGRCRDGAELWGKSHGISDVANGRSRIGDRIGDTVVKHAAARFRSSRPISGATTLRAGNHLQRRAT